MSSGIYQHRPLQPSGPQQPQQQQPPTNQQQRGPPLPLDVNPNANGQGQPSSTSLPPPPQSQQQQPPPVPLAFAMRINELLDTVRNEFDLVAGECGSLKLQKDQFESQINSQITELSNIRQTLLELEAMNAQTRQHYEIENNQLRAELASVRGGGGGGSSASAPSARDGGGIGRGGERDGERRRERDRERDRDMMDLDGREGKRLRRDEKKEFGRELAPPPPSGSSSSYPGAPSGGGGPSSSSSSSAQVGPIVRAPSPLSKAREGGLSHYGGVGGGGSTSLGLNLNPSSTTSGEALSDLDPDMVPHELKKEGSDWWAIFNPKVHRVLDVSLTLTLTHESVVCCVRFSSDGKYLATGCNKTAQIYDTKTGAKTCILAHDSAMTKPGQDLYIRSVCFSPDGKYLATGAEDRQIRIWDIAKKRIRNFFEGHTQEIYSLDFSRDGRLIVSGSGDKTARIWDMETNSCKILSILEPDTIDAGVTSVAISPDGRLVAAGSLDMLVRIWDVATGNLIERLRGHKDSVYSVAFSPDGKGIVSGSLDKSLKYWDIGPLLRSPQRSVALVQGVVDGGSGKKEGGEKGSACTINFTGHKDYVLSVAVSPDGAWVVSGSKDRGVQFWNPRDAQTQLMLQGHKNSVISIDLSPAGGLLATGSGDWQARVWSYTPMS